MADGLTRLTSLLAGAGRDTVGVELNPVCGLKRAFNWFMIPELRIDVSSDGLDATDRLSDDWRGPLTDPMSDESVTSLTCGASCFACSFFSASACLSISAILASLSIFC